MAARRRSRWLAFVVIATATAACNTLSGGHDRFLEDSDAARAVKPIGESGSGSEGDDDGGFNPTEDGPVPIVDADLPDNRDSAVGPVFITVSTSFTTINGAAHSTTAGGTEITAVTVPNYHAILVPNPQPNITSDDYTVYATIRTPVDSEWGILTRGQVTGDAYAIGSKFGTADHLPFLGSFPPTDWNPTLDSKALAADGWVFVANARYNVVLKAVGNQIYGKIWNAALTEPPGFQLNHNAPWSTGRRIGYYNYLPGGPVGAVLESLRVSVP